MDSNGSGEPTFQIKPEYFSVFGSIISVGEIFGRSGRQHSGTLVADIAEPIDIFSLGIDDRLPAFDLLRKRPQTFVEPKFRRAIRTRHDISLPTRLATDARTTTQARLHTSRKIVPRQGRISPSPFFTGRGRGCGFSAELIEASGGYRRRRPHP